jgi:hypothetical protein
VPNSLYPPWMRSPGQKGFVEQLEETYRKNKAWYQQQKPLYRVPPRALPKTHDGILRGPRRIVTCWSCGYRDLDSDIDDICIGCKWVICPNCRVCSDNFHPCRWLDQYGLVFVSNSLPRNLWPFTRNVQNAFLDKEFSRIILLKLFPHYA